MSRAYSEASAGLLPVEPALVRWPTHRDRPLARSGRQAYPLVQVRVLPAEIRGDARARFGRPIGTRRRNICERFSIFWRLTRLALRRLVLAARFGLRRSRTENPTYGATISREHHLDQNFFCVRPAIRATASGKGLYLCGASTWARRGNRRRLGVSCREDARGWQ